MRNKVLFLPMLQLIALLLTVVLPVGADAALLKTVDVHTADSKTELAFHLSGKIKYKLFTLDHPDRVVIDLYGVNFHDADNTNDFKTIDLSNTAIKRIRTGRRGKSTQRVVLDLNEPVLMDHQLIAKKRGGSQLGLELKPLKIAFKTTIEEEKDLNKMFQKKSLKGPVKEEKSQKSTLRNVVIAIDAGHGGEDPGAIGPNGTFEKDVVLSIAKKLARSINTRSGYQAVLIREGDYYIPLSKRREIARKQHNADLFLSIHADSWKRRSAKGASVYALSRKGASSALARHLAAHEKAANKKGGAQSGKESKLLTSVLADLAMEGSMEHSMRVGDYVLQELGGITKLHKKKVEQRAFAVLKSTDVPSLLIETGFISNPTEERQLKSSRYQHKLVKAMTEGVQRYFEQQPPPDTWLAAWKEQAPAKHRIARGETLSGIAQRYRVSQKRLKKANNLRTDLIYIGQVLHIPSS